MNTGERLKFLRNSKKLTLDEVAAAVGTIKQTIYKYEHNIVSNIPRDRIDALATFLDTTPAYLLCLTDDPNPIQEQNNITTVNKMSDPDFKSIKEFLDALSEIGAINHDGSVNSEGLSLVADFIKRNADILRRTLPSASNDQLTNYILTKIFVKQLFSEPESDNK